MSTPDTHDQPAQEEAPAQLPSGFSEDTQRAMGIASFESFTDTGYTIRHDWGPARNRGDLPIPNEVPTETLSSFNL